MEQWTELEKKRRNLQLLNLIFYCAATAGVLLYLWNAVVGITLTAAALLGIVLVVRPNIKEFRRSVKRRVVESNYGGFVTGLEYREKEGIPLEVIAGSDLLWLKSDGKGYVGREDVTGSHNGRAFQQSDISLLRRQYADEKLEKKSLEYIVGTMAVADCGSAFPTDVEIISKDFLKESEAERFFEHKKTMSPVEIGDGELAEKFYVYAVDPEAAAELLAPAVTRHIRNIRETAGSPVLVGLVGDKLYVVLQGRFVNTDWGFKSPLPQDIFTARQLPELPEIFALADSVQR